MSRAKKTSRIIWKAGARPAKLPSGEHNGQVYRSWRDPDPQDMGSYVPGNLFVVVDHDMMPSHTRGTEQFVCLEAWWGDFSGLNVNRSMGTSAPIPVGTILIYAGTVRVREAAVRGRDKLSITRNRHTFITSLGVCIVVDCNLVKPI